MTVFSIRRLLQLLPACLILINSQAIAQGKQSQTDTPALEQVSVLFATVRNRNSNTDGEAFGGQRGPGITGLCVMEYEPIWGMDKIADSLPFYVPEERIHLAGVKEMPAAQFWEDVTVSNGQNKGNIVVYVHGYNIGFEKSCRRASIFQRNLNLHDRLILFSWPADGNVLNYTLDEADLTWSIYPLEQLLSKLVRRFGAGRIDVVGHSLGGRGVVNALSRMARHGPAPLINELVLIAPDMDSEIFGQLLPEIRPLIRRITLYASENDHALRLSREVHGYPRLGEGGELLSVFPGMETIDISGLRTRVPSGHIYHLFNPKVGNDIMRLLDEGTPAAERPGLVSDEKNGIEFWRMKASQ